MKLVERCALALVSSSFAGTLAASSEDCLPGWRPTFGPRPGVEGAALAQAVFDDGTGPALFVAGTITEAGSLPVASIARWDGTSWSPLGAGIQGWVYALEVFDDGSGPALYVGGSFTAAGGVSAACVARWDGTSWSTLGSGMSGLQTPSVTALEVFDDGSGPALYAAGRFRYAGGVETWNVARWDGTSWSAVGTGITGSGGPPRVSVLAVFDDGDGSALYAGGLFDTAGGTLARNVARWDGASWSPLGPGLGARVSALATFDEGDGAALYAGGEFDLGDGPFERIARWDGASWSAVGGGITGGSDAHVEHLELFDDGSGLALYAGGRFSAAGGVPAQHLARWDGTAWSAVGDGPSLKVETMLAFDEGNGDGPELFVTGYHPGQTTGPTPRGLAKWNGARWRPVGKGLDDPVRALATFDDGTGAALHAGGSFHHAGGEPIARIARWDGASWAALGAGVDGSVQVLLAFDDGGGPALFVGGDFSTAGGAPASRIARWRSGSWASLGVIAGTTVRALAACDEGTGPALYAGGSFTAAGGVAANNVARWDGASWTPLGAGPSNGVDRAVTALAVFDDGSGPALFVAGGFTSAGGVAAAGVARWDGLSWSPLGSGILGSVVSLAVFDGGSGPALYAGGEFTSAGGVVMNHIARWDGASWSSLGDALGGTVHSLLAHDDGSGAGPALFAAGGFTSVGGVPSNRIARWDGASWSPLGGGIDGGTNDLVLALAAFDDASGAGPGLFVGGLFHVAQESGDGHLARWQRAADTTPPAIACPLSLLVPDALTGPPGAIVHYSVASSDDCDPSPALVCVPPSGSFFPRGTTLVTCTATDASGNQAVCSFEVTVAPKARRR